jgi:ABC-type transport system involved in Fe-S cluster assembly fused permease/ATPase subunit
MFKLYFLIIYFLIIYFLLYKASVNTQTSLSALNFGQNFIFSCGLTGMMLMASQSILNGM